MEDLVQRLSSWATNSPLQMGTLSVCLLSSGYIVYKTVHGVRAAKGRIYPPGPPKDPLIGNLRSLPMTEWYEKFCEWQGLYGTSNLRSLPTLDVVNGASFYAMSSMNCQY